MFEQPDGTSYCGYFQSYRYFDECKASLAQFLRFNADHRARSEAMLFAYRRQYRKPLVSVHVRRDDYLTPGNEEAFGNLASDGYYHRAAAEIGDDVLYLVFSDDLAWCEQSLGINGALLMDVDHGTALSFMAGCDVNVVANSTFSWWGAYLNPTAEVYAPSRWFAPAMPPPNDRQDDIVPPTWRTIPAFGE